MLNKKETPIGSIIRCHLSDKVHAICEVIETYESGCKCRIVDICPGSESDGKMLGTEPTIEYECCMGVICCLDNMRHVGFISSDERGWRLMYYFGDMKLLYRYDNRSHLARFRFKPSGVRRYVSISCRYVHELQNIMKFLTGCEMEFTWSMELPELQDPYSPAGP